MPKRPADLREAMESRAQTSPAARNQGKDKPSPAAAPGNGRPGREGKSNVTGYFPPEVKKQLRVLAAEHDTTIQNLLAEALNDLFAKNGKPEVAPLEER